MSRIDQIAQLVYEFLSVFPKITDNPNIFDRQGNDSHVVLSPSDKVNNIPHLDIQYFDVWLIALLEAQKKDTLEAQKKLLYGMRTISLLGYIWTKRVVFTVTANTNFAEGDAVHNAGSTATGTIVRISGGTFYLKDVVGTWLITDSIANSGAGSTTLTTGETEEIYPIHLDIMLQMSGLNGFRINIEGRWEV